MNMLKMSEAVTFGEWLRKKARDLKATRMGLEEIGQLATRELGFTVTRNNVYRMDTQLGLGLKQPRPAHLGNGTNGKGHNGQTVQIRTLADSVLSLHRQLGVVPSEALMDLVK